MLAIALNKSKRSKFYIKTFRSGIGIKTVNIETNAENYFMITNQSEELKDVDKDQTPLSGDFPKEDITDDLVNLDPYWMEVKPDIAGFHIYEEEDCNINLEQTRVIFVANTKLAKEKGVHVNIPCKLTRVCADWGKEIERKEDGKQIINKLLTIVVSDYVINLNIYHESCSLSKETQTDPVNIVSDSNILGAEVKSKYSNPPSTKSNYSELESSSNNILTELLSSSSLKPSDSLPQYSTTENKEMQPISQNNSKIIVFKSTNLPICESSSCELNIKSSVSSHKVKSVSSIRSAHIVDDESETETTKSKSKTSVKFSHPSNESLEIINKNGNSLKSNSSINNKQFLNVLSARNSMQSHFSSSLTVNSSFSEKGLRMFNSSEVSLKQVKERLNTVTFSLQQLKSVIENLDSEDCAVSFGPPQRGDGPNLLEEEERQSDNTTVSDNLCDCCGCFYPKTKFQSHFCALQLISPTKKEIFENSKINLLPTQDLSEEVISPIENEKIDFSDEKLEIVGKGSIWQLDLSKEPSDQPDTFANMPEQVENDVKEGSKFTTIEEQKTPRKNYFKFIANRITKSDSFKVPNELEKKSSEKLLNNVNIDLPAKKIKNRQKGMFKSVGNLLYLAAQIKTDVGVNKPIALKDSTKIIELFSKPSTVSLSSKSLHVMPSSSSSIGVDRNNVPRNHILPPMQNKQVALDIPKMRESSQCVSETSSSLPSGLYSLYSIVETRDEQEDGKRKLKTSNKNCTKNRRRFKIFGFKI